MKIAETPEPPYYAVIFNSILKPDTTGYSEMAMKMEELAKQQPGFLGFESAREEIGVTISYWKSLEDIKHWKSNIEHQHAQELGKEKWYKQYVTRICLVEREYGFQSESNED